MSQDANNKNLVAISQGFTLPAEVSLFTLDATEIGGGFIYFHPGTDRNRQLLRFRDVEFIPLPVEITGLEMKSQGELPRPIIRFSNIARFMTSLILQYDDLINARLIRTRVFEPYLQGPVSSPNPDYDPAMAWPDDVYYFSQKRSENKSHAEFELVTSLDLEGVKLPRRKLSANFCSFFYRGADGCGFAEDRFVANILNIRQNGSITRYRGVYTAEATYTLNDTATFVDGGITRIHRALRANFKNFDPTNTLYWAVEQVITGLYDDNRSYVPGEVAYIEGEKGREYYIYRGNPGAGVRPPNSIFWTPDRCGKMLSSCILRFDPENRGFTMPFGGFPGVSVLPTA